MIIFGSRVSTTPVEYGEFECPACRSVQNYQRYKSRRWFTLYFLPVIPLDSLGEQIVCLRCSSSFDPAVLDRAAPNEMLESEHGLLAAFDESPQQSGQSPQQSGQSPQQSGQWTRAETRTSGWAITSLVSAIISPLLICTCFFSIIPALAAVVSGHFALAKIKGSAGRLRGWDIAVSGLVLGYIMTFVSIAGMVLLGPGFLEGTDRAQQQNAPGAYRSAPVSDSDRLRFAESEIITAGPEGAATGNTETAKQLAREFSTDMKQMRDLLFTADEGFSISDGNFITHCEYHHGRCAFVVHVPSYRNFDEDAKEALAELAWKVAQKSVESVLKPGDRLAVGMRGTFLYGSVMIGTVDDGETSPGDRRFGERADLAAFFSPAIGSSQAPADLTEQTQNASEQTADSDASPAEAVDIKNDQSELYRYVPSPTPPAASTEPDETVVPSIDAMPLETNEDAEESPKLPTNPIHKSMDQVATPNPSDQGKIAVPLTDTLASKEGTEDSADLALPQNVIQRFPDMGWAIESLAFTPNGRWLIAGKMDEKLMVLSVQSGEKLDVDEDLDELGPITRVAVSPDGKHVAASGHRGATILWSLDEDGQLQDRMSLAGQNKAVQCLVFSSAAPFLVSGDYSGELLWQSLSARTSMVKKRKAFSRPVIAVFVPQQGLTAMATDGSTLVSVNLKTAEVVGSHQLGRRFARFAAFSDDGKMLAVCSGREIEVWDTEKRVEIAKLDSKRETQWSVQFHPDGHRLVSGGRGKATLWDLNKQTAIGEFDLGGVLYIKTIDISADGKQLAAIPAAAGQTLTVVQIPDWIDGL